jgi:hypothetical protein
VPDTLVRRATEYREQIENRLPEHLDIALEKELPDESEGYECC